MSYPRDGVKQRERLKEGKRQGGDTEGERRRIEGKTKGDRG